MIGVKEDSRKDLGGVLWCGRERATLQKMFMRAG